MRVTLYQFPKYGKIPNLSPFCLKLEAYLKFAKIPYETVSTINLRGAPKKKLPYVQINDRILADSTFIIHELARHNPEWDLDQHLTEEQKALATLIQRTCEESTALAGFHMRWVEEDGRNEFNPILLKSAPWGIRQLIAHRIYKKARKRSWLHGIGRHGRDEIINIVNRDCHALSTLLGDQKYFFNNRISTTDCIVYGVLAQIAEAELPSSLVPVVAKYPNLVKYVKRIGEEFEEHSS